MLKSSLVISTLIATTIFISPHSLLAGQEETSGTPVTTSSTPAKLSLEAQSIEDQLNRDWTKLSSKLTKWDLNQKERAETGATVTVTGLGDETREQAALREILDMRNADGLTPLHLAVMHKNADITRLFLAALGEEANSTKLLLNGKSLLRLAATTSEKTQHSDDSAFETMIVLRKSGYKFDNSEIGHFGKVNILPQNYIWYDVNDWDSKYSALAYLLGSDKSHAHKGVEGFAWQVMKPLLPEHYKTLSEKGFAHLIDIPSYMEEILNKCINCAKLQEQSKAVREKKSQLQQLAEATARLNLN